MAELAWLKTRCIPSSVVGAFAIRPGDTRFQNSAALHAQFRRIAGNQRGVDRPIDTPVTQLGAWPTSARPHTPA
jgi:hypothetical protein